MVCSGWEIEEDPYDLVSRLSENSNRAIFEGILFVVSIHLSSSLYFLYFLGF